MEYTIKQVSERMGLSEHTVRYYEKEGLLPNIARSPSGIRRFSDRDIEWLGLICCLKKTGMSIQQIREFVELYQYGDGTIPRRVEILEQQRESVHQQIRMLQQYLVTVEHKIAFYQERQKESLARSKEAGQ